MNNSNGWEEIGYSSYILGSAVFSHIDDEPDE